MSSISSVSSGSNTSSIQYQAYLQRLQAAKTDGNDSPAVTKAENKNPGVDPDHDGH